MKILDRFVLKSFFRPFLITFFVMVLFLLMQFVWKYIDDLVGRGVEWYYIAELLFYTSATLVPMALPLAVLLSSIMVLGTLGENYEMAALKSSGLSLMRVMRPLLGFVLILSVAAFLFANYVIPVANLHSENLRRNISNKKPALSIRPGIFYTGIAGYSIKVSDKYGPNQNLLDEILIYDHTQNNGNMKVIIADSGKMKVTDNEQFLEITLYDGHSYEDMVPKKRKDRDNKPFIRSDFKESLIRFNLIDFQSDDLRKTGQKEFDMLNVRQLNEVVDSLHQSLDELQTDFARQMVDKYAQRELYRTDLDDKEGIDTIQLDTAGAIANMSENLLDNFDIEERSRILQNSTRIARGNRAYFTNASAQYNWRKIVITRHVLEWQKKFSSSFSVIVLFFIGAPLGAIIRKGGMGMPVVVSVFIFIVHHVTNFSFEKLGRFMLWTPFEAMWTANLILLPIGFWLTYKSATDSVIFNMELYMKPFQKVSALFEKRFKKKQA
ncbi:MAG: LptF/LptG family permease [Bacteroidetes bacterium]|nr:LptF/LptG family permease [Bacteroidota bacterium]